MKIDQDVLAVISGLEIRSRRIYMRKLERKLYLDVNKVLEALGGNWDRKSQSHVFEEDPVPLIELVLVTGEVTTAKDIGFFPTPAPLARQLVELAEVRPGMTCLEPSAGTGRIVDALVAAGAAVVAIERDDKMREALQKRAGNSVIDDREEPHGFFVVANRESDFMECLLVDQTGEHAIAGFSSTARFDRVVMNPPFIKSGKGDHIDHVRHAFEMLKPGGVLVSVLPNGVLFRQDRRHAEFLAWAFDLSGRPGTPLVPLAPLPEGSFKESGTMVNTCTLKLVR